MATCTIPSHPPLLHRSPHAFSHPHLLRPSPPRPPPRPCFSVRWLNASQLSSKYTRSRASSQNPRFISRSSLTDGAGSINDGDDDDDDLSSTIENADWRSFRARLLQSSTTSLDTAVPTEQWAHSLVEPECGCLLLAHPNVFTLSQHYFHQAVIFLFAHSKEGSAGLILNRPTEYTLGQLAGFEDFLEFRNCPLYMGGDVGANALHVIHGVPALEGSKEIVSGVYMGGIKSMKENVQSGRSSAMDYRWFVRYAGWGPGQLEREVAAGVWYLACSSKDFILKHALDSSKPLWREILEHMGDPYSGISKRAYGEM